MRRVATSLTFGVLAFSLFTAPALAGALAGMIQMPSKLSYKVSFRAHGYWRGLQNEVLKKRPPLVDPRQKMVVALEGAGLPKDVHIKPEIHMSDMRFWPPVLPVRRKTTVSFINDDKVQHKVASDGEETTVPEMPLPPGTKGRHSFTNLGTYMVTCKEVPHMKATVIVLDQPQFARVDMSGVFFFPEVPDGEYTLKVWYDGKWIHSQKVQLKGPKSKVKVQIPASKG